MLCYLVLHLYRCTHHHGYFSSKTFSLKQSMSVAGLVAWMCMTVANDLFGGDGFAPYFLV